MGKVFRALGPTSRTQAPIHLVGESGTGKHTVALAVHLASGKPTLACVRCTGLNSADGLRDVLIGGGTATKPEAGSALYLAKKGTLLLVEISGLSLELQAVLLGLLGGELALSRGGQLTTQPTPRLISTSAHDIATLVRQGRFRADLYYRLAGATVEVPPLRQRSEDIVGLARLFLADDSRRDGNLRGPCDFTIEAADLLIGYSWPGNVRQLRGVVAAAAAHASEGLITHHVLAQFLVRAEPAPAVQIPLGTSLADAERMVIRAALAAHRGNRQDTAGSLGISRRTLYQKLCDYKRQEPAEHFPRARRRVPNPSGHFKKKPD